MNEISRFAANERASRAVVCNGMVFLAGCTAEDRSQDILGQTAQALAKVDHWLSVAGTDRSRLLTAQVFLKDIKRDFKGVNEVWDAWTVKGAAPTRATVQADMASEETLVEIVVSAALGSVVASSMA